MKGILKKLDFASEQVLGILGLIGILIITANAFCRFVLQIPMSWADEFLRTIMVYGYFVGAALMFCHGECMHLEILESMLKKHPAAYRILNVVLAVIDTAFFGLMSWYLGKMVLQYMVDGTTTSTSTTPAWVVPLGCMLGMLIITVAAVMKLVASVCKTAAQEEA